MCENAPRINPDRIVDNRKILLDYLRSADPAPLMSEREQAWHESGLLPADRAAFDAGWDAAIYVQPYSD